MAPLSAVSESLQGVTHVRRISEYSGEPGKVAAEDTANRCICEGIDIRHHFLTVFVGNLQGSKTMIQ